ncbi:MAG TPA: hypothetical protein VFB32_05540 [Rudaea sp.]|nr:hypothetical protein [Rudaea sp.]
MATLIERLKQYKEVATILVFFFGLLSAGFTYFATAKDLEQTKKDLDHFKCLSLKREQIIKAQQIAYATEEHATSARVELRQLKSRLAALEQIPQRQGLKVEMDEVNSEIKPNRTKAH